MSTPDLHRFKCKDHTAYGRKQRGCGFVCYVPAEFAPRAGACPSCHGDEYGGLEPDDAPSIAASAPLQTAVPIKPDDDLRPRLRIESPFSEALLAVLQAARNLIDGSDELRSLDQAVYKFDALVNASSDKCSKCGATWGGGTRVHIPPCNGT